MILQVDIGNTNVRWRLIEQGGVFASAVAKHDGRLDYDEVFRSVDVVPDSIQVVTVILGEKERFDTWSHQRWAISPRFADVEVACAGVRNGYNDVSQMGGDRWLAMIAAYNLSRHDCLVVDSGSACTVDLVLADGRHLGGYIVPGLQLMKDALFRDTDRVKLQAINYDEQPQAGRTTEQAVSSGLQLMLLGLVSMALDEILLAGAHRPGIYLAGGGGENLSEQLKSYLSSRNRLNDVGDIILKPDLVFEGLPFVCG